MHRKQFEYRVEWITFKDKYDPRVPKFTNFLNGAGQEGWELVEAIMTASNNMEFLLIYKREKG